MAPSSKPGPSRSGPSRRAHHSFQVGDAVYVEAGADAAPRVAVLTAVNKATCEVRWFQWPEETRLKGAGCCEMNEVLYVNVEPATAPPSRKGKEATPVDACSASIPIDDILRKVEMHGTRILCDEALADVDELDSSLSPHLFCERAIDPASESVVPFDWEAVWTTGVDEGRWDLDAGAYRPSTPVGSSPLAWVEVVSPLRQRRQPKPRRIWSPAPDVPRPRTYGKKAGVTAPTRPKPVAAPVTPRRRWTRPAAPRRRRAQSEESEATSESDSDSSDDASSDASSVSQYSDSASTAATSDVDDESSDDDHDVPPTLKRKMATPRTPRKRIRTSAPVTPSRSHVLAMQPALPALPSQAPKMTSLSPEELSRLTPQARAKRLLHVGATPERLPGREEQYDEVLACVQDAVDAGIGGCVYVSGVPGQGKTATVREVIRALGNQAEAGEIAPFHFVEINGMKLPDPSEAYSLLWSAIHGGEYSSRARLAPKAALKALTAHFNRADTSEDRPTTVVLMDEMDAMIDARQEVIYNLFDWPNRAGSRLVVIAVANNMTLPESALTPKVASRLGMERITFMSYSHQELERIVKTRLGLAGGEMDQAQAAATAGCGDVIADFAIQLVCKRVANVNGDARRVLDILRRAIELVEGEAARRAKNGGDAAVEQVQASHIISIYNSFLKTPSTVHVRALPLHAKVLLHSLLSCLAKTGGDGALLSDVLTHHAAVCQMHAVSSHLQGPAISTWPQLAPCVAELCALGLVRTEGGAVGLCGANSGVRLVLRGAPEDVGTALANDPDRRIKKIVSGR